MTKIELLNELHHSTYAMIQPSPIHGIGVFAIRDIPKGTKNIFSKESGEWIKVHRSEVEALPEHTKNLVETHCLFDDDNYFLPDYGFKKLDIVIFLNHSDNPNIISVNEGIYFETIQEIKCGEELLIDYGTIVDSNE
jgi:SET domain-containing protein